jgi:hypothetical protein
MVQAPSGYKIAGVDVDSQELWIASVLGDCNTINKNSESESCNNFSTDNGRNFFMIGQNSIRPTNLMNENKFHHHKWIEINNSTQNPDGQVVMRRKKKCLCDSRKF